MESSRKRTRITFAGPVGESALQSEPSVHNVEFSGRCFGMIARRLSELMKTSDFSLQDLASTLISVSKKVTNSNWCEFLYLEGDALIVCSTTSGAQREVMQTIKRLQVGEENAAGYCAVHKEMLVVNNAATSQLYTGFKQKLWSFSKDLMMETPQTILCIPIFSEYGKVFGVIHLFDKVDEYRCLSVYSEDDFSLLDSITMLVSGILSMRISQKSTRNYIDQLDYFNAQRHNMTTVSLQLMRKESLIHTLEYIIRNLKAVTFEMVDLIAEVMECEGVLVHLVSREKEVCPWIAFGIKLNCDVKDEVKALCTRTSEYVSTDIRTFLQVRDYTKEKHFNTFINWDPPFKSSLSLPIFQEGSLAGVIEFYRLKDEFTYRDEHIGGIIVNLLSKVSPARFFARLPLSGNRYKTIPKIYTQYGSNTLKEVREFSMRPESFNFDFVRYIRQVRNSIRDLVKLESCSMFIKDSMTGSLWTWVSYNCEPLSLPISKKTLIGYSTLTQQIVNEQFPTGNKDLDSLTAFESSSHDTFLVIPTLGEVLKTQVLAVAILSRKGEKFTNDEVAVVSKLMRVAAYTLESLFFSNYDVKEIAESEEPQTPSLRKKERFTTLAEFVAPVRVLDEPEYALTVKRSRSIILDEANSDIDSHFHTLKSLCAISTLSPSRLALIKDFLSKLADHPEDTLTLLTTELPTLIPCQKAKLFILHSSRMYLKDIETGKLSTPIGLVKQVFTTGKSIRENTNVAGNAGFAEGMDCLGVTGSVDSFMAVPIYYLYEEIIGVLAFVNSKVCFNLEDLSLAHFLSLIPSKTLLNLDNCTKKWTDVLKEGLKQEELLSWCKEIMSVSAVCQQTVSKLKDVASSLVNTSDFTMIMQALIEVLCANMNVEDAQILIRHSDGYIASFTRTKSIQLLQAGEQLELFKSILQCGKSHTIMENYFGYSNSMLVPIRNGTEIIGGILLCNKKDASLSFYCSFNTEDHVIAQKYAVKLSVPISQWMSEDRVDTEQVRKMINAAAANVQAYPLMNVIRKAALQLLDCDRSTIYFREGDRMVVYAQGIEQEIPEGFSVPLGTGIVGHVAMSGHTVTLEDAYLDPRFNKQIDSMTGYRTKSMLCVPVFDSGREVIAAVQMINKRKGMFNEDDLKILDMFSEVISSALQIFEHFKAMMGDNSKLMNVLNSIQSYIFVINAEGKLEYSNQKFEKLFGYSDDIGRNRHFSYWLRDNPDLMRDMQSVIDSPGVNVCKEFQNLNQAHPRRTASLKSLSLHQHVPISKIHYTVKSLTDLTTTSPLGLLLIIDDVTPLVQMKSDLQMMKSQLKSQKQTTAISAQTGLYTCITSLQQVRESINETNHGQMGEVIEGVINILKSGNLEKTVIDYNSSDSQADTDLRLFIDKEFLGRDQRLVSESHSDSTPIQAELQGSQGYSPISFIRTWNLNIWEIGDLFPHIVSIFSDFNIINQFRIEPSTLTNFLSEVRRLYDHRRNPFHNFYHGFSVLHSISFILTSTKAQTWFNAEDTFAILLGALCHDVDHTGRTNSFEVGKASNLAIFYHDIAVLEQHHAATTFFILRKENSNILENCPKDTYTNLRKTVIAGILATDMSKHFPMLLKLNLRFKDLSTAPIGSREYDKFDMVEMLVHCCDLAHITKEFQICEKWAQLLREEMRDQAKEEVELGLPVTPFMKDLEDVGNFYKNEINFTTVIVKPLWECVHQCLEPYTSLQLTALSANIQHYKDQLALHEKSLL